MKILLVSDGAIPIPPPAWGGVENLIWQQKHALEAAGHEVSILNKRKVKRIKAIRERPWQYDIVHLHVDCRSKVWVPLARLLGFNLVVSTHYGYAAFPEHWSPSYRRTFGAMKKAKHMILLSNEIRQTFEQRGCRSNMHVLPNGINCSDVRFARTSTKQAIFLGRIQERKKQALASRRLDGTDVECDFAGPTEDPNFRPNGSNVRYIGEWSRAQVHNDLTDYACLVLLSDGEGHAAVVSEAMAAGLSLVLSPEASHNLDLRKPWITIVDRERDDLAAAIKRAVAENAHQREQIRRYCEETFDWGVILPRYVNILENIARQRSWQQSVLPSEQSKVAG